jgi:hypothetical protein
LKESNFFFWACGGSEPFCSAASRREYSHKGLFANTLNQAYFFYVSKCNIYGLLNNYVEIDCFQTAKSDSEVKLRHSRKKRPIFSE